MSTTTGPDTGRLSPSLNPTDQFAEHALELVMSHEGAVSLFLYRGVLVLVWLTVPTSETVTRIKHSLVSVGAAGPRPLVVLQLLAPRSSMPSLEVRKELVWMWQPIKDDLAGMSLVLEDHGFWASAARAAINGMVLAANNVPMVARLKISIRVDPSLTEAVAWLPGRLAASGGPHLTSAELLQAAHTARDRTH